MRTLLIASALCFAANSYAQVPEPPAAPEAPEAPVLEESDDVSITRKELELTPDIVEKLDGEQLHTLLKEKELTKRERNAQRAESVGPEIAAPLGFFLTFMVIVFLPLFFGWRRQILLHQTLRAMVEKGAEIPVELIAPRKPKHNDLRRGVILVGLGLGLSIFLGLLPDAPAGVWACGLIPALMGAGYLVVWRLQPKEKQDHSEPHN